MTIKLHILFLLSLPYGDVFYHSFNFNEFIFVNVVNIRLSCDGKTYLLTKGIDICWTGYTVSL